MRLADKIAVVTGAGSGIGQACAVRFAAEGARVVGADVTGEPRCDVARLEDLQALATRTVNADVLVHAAGISTPGRTLETTEADFERMWRVNFLGAVNLVKAFDTRLRPGASIIFISSINALVGAPGLSAYAASKGALLTLGYSLALELAERRIRVNTVCPASVDTLMLRASFDRQPDPAAARARNILRHPLGRLGTPDDVANLVLFLASDESAWITGSVHMIDGGALINRT
jgi:NAD(P)-dependent dehydrogenase (short-subunit alcohol dehydrogenase family)